jgi:hypothetical protein
MDKSMEKLIQARLEEKNKAAAQPLIDSIYQARQSIKSQEQSIASWQKQLNELLVVKPEDIITEAGS